MIQIQRENFGAIRDELLPLWQAHYDEASEDRDALPFDMDVVKYAALDAAGALLVVTARNGDALVGYVVALMGSSLHCKSLDQAVCDLHYLAPQHRGGRTAMRLFQAFEQAAGDLGAVRIMVGTPTANNQGRLLDALGWRPIEVTYTKLLGVAA